MIGPYVGPGPFGALQRLFGRDEEIEELRWRLVADRIMVLYSPSGAGKTSLLMAENGLIATLSSRFHVLPLIRIGRKDRATPINAVLTQLQQAEYGTVREDDTLLAYFTRIIVPETNPPKRLMLVFDQFEEIFSSGASQKDQADFFKELGKLLLATDSDQHPIWLLVSMREEYFSWLDAFRDDVPTRLTNTFRLNLLSREKAIEAVKGPAEAAGVTFPKEGEQDAVTKLVGDLSIVRRRSQDGGIEEHEGTTVEPVLLQVICSDLWNRLSGNGQPPKKILISDIQDYKPETALQDYCDKALDGAATGKRAGPLREWIDRRLLTLSGRRAPTMIDPSEKDCPSVSEISALEEIHLIRRQNRDDGEWYELAHDRLTGPVRQSIDVWRTKNRAAWQQQAHAWHLGGELSGFFATLPGHGILQIPKPDDDAATSETETRFLAAYSQYLRSRRNRRTVYLVVVFAMVMVVFLSWQQIKTEANLLVERNTNAVQAGVFSILGSKPSLDLGARAAVAGAELQANNPDTAVFNFRNLLSEYLNKTRHVEQVEFVGDGVSKMVVLDQEHIVIAQIGSFRHWIQVRYTAEDIDDWLLGENLLAEVHPQGVRTLALLAGGLLATGDSEGNIQLWDLKARQLVGAVLTASAGNHAARLRSAVRSLISANGILYAGYELGAVAAWDLSVVPAPGNKPLWSAAMPSRVGALALLGGGNAVVAADISNEEQITLLRYVAGEIKRIKLPAVPKEGDWTGAFYSVAVSADNRFVAAGNRAGKIHVWDIASKSHRWVIDAHEQTVAQLKYLQDGSLLSVSWDGRLKTWSMSDGENSPPVGKTLLELSRQLVSVATIPTENAAFVTTEKGDVLKVSLAVDRHPFGQLLAGAGRIARLVEEGDKTRLLIARQNMLMISDLNSDSGTPQGKKNIPLPKTIVGMTRANGSKTVFLAEEDRVLIMSNELTAAQPIDGFVIPVGEKITAIQVDDAGSLLTTRIDVAADTPNWKTRIWALSVPASESVKCEVEPPASFPSALRFLTFRPGTSDFVTVYRDSIRYWHPIPGSEGCIQVEEDSIPMPKVPGDIVAVAFSPDGKQLWVGNYSGKLYSITFDAQRTVMIKKDDSTTVATALAVSVDGTVAMGDAGGGLYVFQPEATTPMQVGQDFHDSSFISPLSLSRDGKRLVSSSDAGTAIWDLRLETWINKACVLASNRTFSKDEYTQYFATVSEKPMPCAHSE